MKQRYNQQYHGGPTQEEYLFLLYYSQVLRPTLLSFKLLVRESDRFEANWPKLSEPSKNHSSGFVCFFSSWDLVCDA